MSLARVVVVSACALGVACSGERAASPMNGRELVISTVGGRRATLTLTVGTQTQFSAAASDANGVLVSPGPTVVWQSSNASASVDSRGLVTGAASGQTDIKATTTLDGVRLVDSVRVTVVVPT